MVEQDLQKMRNDLDTIQDVVGTGLPYGRSDIIGMLAIGALALFGSIMSLLPLGLSPTMVRLTFGPLVVLGCIGVAVRYYRNKPHRTPQKDREAYQGAVFMGVAGGLSIIFVLWSMFALHLKPVILLSIHFYILASAIVLYALTKSQRRIYLPIAISFIAFALARPFTPWSMDFTLMSATLALATFGCATAMHMNLRKQDAVTAVH